MLRRLRDHLPQQLELLAAVLLGNVVEAAQLLEQARAGLRAREEIHVPTRLAAVLFEVAVQHLGRLLEQRLADEDLLARLLEGERAVAVREQLQMLGDVRHHLSDLGRAEAQALVLARLGRLHSLPGGMVRCAQITDLGRLRRRAVAAARAPASGGGGGLDRRAPTCHSARCIAAARHSVRFTGRSPSCTSKVSLKRRSEYLRESPNS